MRTKISAKFFGRGAMLYAERQQGHAEGKVEGIIEGKAALIVNVMKKLQYNLMASMDFLDIPKSEYAAYSEIIKKNYPDVTI